MHLCNFKESHQGSKLSKCSKRPMAFKSLPQVKSMRGTCAFVNKQATKYTDTQKDRQQSAALGIQAFQESSHVDFGCPFIYELLALSPRKGFIQMTRQVSGVVLWEVASHCEVETLRAGVWNGASRTRVGHIRAWPASSQQDI